MNNFFSIKYYQPLFIYLFIVTTIGCANKVKTVKLTDNLFAKGEKISDSVFDGEVLYYDRSGILVTKSYFSENKRNGFSIQYYPNGIIKDSIIYVNDLTNGFHCQLNEKGHLVYSDYSYFDLGVGPKIFYKNDQPDFFSFSDFDKNVLFYAEYDSIRIRKHYGSILNFNYYSANIDGINKIGLMLYLIEPPFVKISYHIGREDLENKMRKDLFTLDNSRVFIDTLLPKLDKKSEYYIRADYIDSKSNDKEHYFQKLKDSLPIISEDPN